MWLAIYGFYAIDPLARRVILVEKLLKIWCYCLVLLSFNLWMRVNNRLKGRGTYLIERQGRHFVFTSKGKKCVKEHIKMTAFFCAIFALMELPLLLSTI